MLADQFTVITYDRRGHTRSNGWTDGQPSSPGEQSDDAAALIAAIELSLAAVFGNSSGAIMALDMVLRHPESVTAAVLHEPPLGAVVEHPDEIPELIGGLIEGGMASGGPPAAVEAFLRWAIGDANWRAMSAEAKQEASDNAGVFFGSEVGRMEPYHPDDQSLASISVPVCVLNSTGSIPFYFETTAWLASRLGIEVVRVPGTHVPQLDHPDALAESIRTFLRGA